VNHQPGSSTRWLSSLLLALPLLAACQKKTESGAAAPGGGAAPITLALNWLPEPEFGGFYAAREDGAYKRAGLDVKVQGGGAGVPVVQMVATGRADFGTVTADELVLARARGGDVVAVFATFQTAPHGIMVHASRGLKKIEDAFDSGTLALETGLPYIAFLRQKFHWGAAKIVAYDGGIAHFLTDPMFGQQCYITSEPILAKQKGSDPQVFLIADAGFNPYTTIVITRGELLKKNMPMITNAFGGWLNYPEYFFFWCYHGQNAVFNTMGYKNPAMDALIDKARFTTGPEYEAAVKGFIDMAFDEVPRVPIFQPLLNVAMQKNVTGYRYWFHRQLDYRQLAKG